MTINNSANRISLAAFFLICFFSCLSNVVNAQNDKLAVYIDSIFSKWDSKTTPGASVAIIKDGKIIFSKGYGLANLEHKIPNTPATKFHVASVSKQFTAYAVAKLVVEGKLSLDDEIHQYLPELYDFGTPIIIRQLIHHTSGLRQAMRLLAISGQGTGIITTQDKILSILWKQRELNNKPGTEYIYSNSNYILLATIVEKLTKEDFPLWMKRNVFDPIGMDSTLIVTHYRQIVPQRAEPYFYRENEYFRDLDLLWGLYGGTGIHTTVGDMAKWLNYLDSNSSEALSLMMQQGVLANGDTLNYAFGLTINKLNDKLTVIEHGGDAKGYETYTGRIPDAGVGVIIMTNTSEINPKGKAAEIYKFLLSESFPEALKIDSSFIDEHIGYYLVKNNLVPYRKEVFKLIREGEKLYLQIPVGAKFEIAPISDTTYNLIGRMISFSIVDKNDNKQMVIHLENDVFAEKIESLETDYIPTADLSEYHGTYFSPEIETEYRVFSKGDTLITRIVQRSDLPFSLPPIVLNPVMADGFETDINAFKWVGFIRNEDGKVIGFRVTNSNERVRNLWFEKRK